MRLEREDTTPLCVSLPDCRSLDLYAPELCDGPYLLFSPKQSTLSNALVLAGPFEALGTPDIRDVAQKGGQSLAEALADRGTLSASLDPTQ